MGLRSEPCSELPSMLTQAEFAAWLLSRPADDLNHYELLDGRVVMTPPAGYPHGLIEGTLAEIVGTFVRRGNLGKCLGSSQGFDMPSGDTLEPDFSFVSTERWAAMPPPEMGKFLRVVPDLIVEILSPSTAARDRDEKFRIYARNGVREYWMIDPHRRELVVFTRRQKSFDEGRVVPAGTAFGSTVLPGLTLDVAILCPDPEH